MAFYCPVLDKGANKVTKIIINPLLLYFIKELKLHLQKENNKMMLSGTKKSDDYIDSDNDIKQIEYKEESESESASSSDADDTDSDKSSEGWRTPKKESDSEKSNDRNSNSNSDDDSDSDSDSDSDKQKKKESEDNDDYMTRPIKTNKDKEKSDSTEKSLTVPNKTVSLFANPDKIKNPHKYHKELTIKERDLIIKQSTKIMEFIKAIEDGTVAKDVLKFITKFYQLDKTYFE